MHLSGGGYYGFQNIHTILFAAGPPQYFNWLERQSATYSPENVNG